MANFSPSATSIALSCIFTARQILSAIIIQHKGTCHSIGANIVTISKLKQLYLHSTSFFQMYSLPFKRHVLIDHDIQFIRSSLAANQNVWMLRVPLNSPQWECTHDAKVEQSMIFQRVQTKSQKSFGKFSHLALFSYLDIKSEFVHSQFLSLLQISRISQSQGLRFKVKSYYQEVNAWLSAVAQSQKYFCWQSQGQLNVCIYPFLACWSSQAVTLRQC